MKNQEYLYAHSFYEINFIKFAEFSDIDKNFKTQVILRMYFIVNLLKTLKNVEIKTYHLQFDKTMKNKAAESPLSSFMFNRVRQNHG